MVGDRKPASRLKFDACLCLTETDTRLSTFSSRGVGCKVRTIRDRLVDFPAKWRYCCWNCVYETVADVGEKYSVSFAYPLLQRREMQGRSDRVLAGDNFVSHIFESFK